MSLSQKFAIMEFMKKWIGGIVFLLWAWGSGAEAKELISMAVGQVRDHVLTSREVHISEGLEQALYSAQPNMPIKFIRQVESPQFAKQVTSTLLEWVVYLEARSMAVTRLEEGEIDKALAKSKEILGRLATWQDLQVSSRELKKSLERKIMAKKLIRFRAESSVVPVSDAEAERYFHQNRLKFGNLPFENFKSSIKTFLSRQQVEKRLKDWFEVLQAKYQVRNFLAEM